MQKMKESNKLSKRVIKYQIIQMQVTDNMQQKKASHFVENFFFQPSDHTHPQQSTAGH